MSLPEVWVSEIFKKLTLVYGRDFLSRWEGVDMADVMTDWAHELNGLDKSPQRVAYALKNLPTTKPPTVLEFRAIAYRMPADGNEALIERQTHKGAAPSLETLARLAEIRAKAIGSLGDRRRHHNGGEGK